MFPSTAGDPTLDLAYESGNRANDFKVGALVAKLDFNIQSSSVFLVHPNKKLLLDKNPLV